jgi:hypothetical protein
MRVQVTTKQITIKLVEILNGHTSADTAYLVKDYPYGRRLRCQRRTWIETAVKGQYTGRQRFMAQTNDPRKDGIAWNNPHASTYDPFIAMYLDHENHVAYWNAGPGVTPDGDARMRLMGLYEQLTTADRERYDALVARSKHYAEPWTRWDEKISELAAHIRETGSDPVLNGEYWERPTQRRMYLGWDVAPFVVTARRLAEHDAVDVHEVASN